MRDALPDIDELPSQDLLKFEKELLGFYITSHPLTEHQIDAGALHAPPPPRSHATLRRRRSDHRRDDQPREKESSPRTADSAGMQMAIITLEDLEGQIDGTMFAETFAEITKRYPGHASRSRRSSSSKARSTASAKRRAS